MPEKNTKISSIILLRAVAALGVCIVHIQLNTGIKFNSFFDYIIQNGTQGVAVFFVISGFVLPYSLFIKGYRIKEFFNFILKRSIRVDPPYWCCILLLFILTPLPFSDFNLRSLFLHVTYLVPFVKSANWYCNIFWTLSIEFQFYILLGLLYPVLTRLPVWLSVSIIILISAFCIRYTEQGIIISHLYQFAFGFIAFFAYTNLLSRKWFWVVFIAFTAYIIFAKSIISGLVPALTVVFLLYYKSDAKVVLFTFLGNISYSLYLVHIPVSVFIIKLLNPISKNLAITSIACLFFSILIAYFFYLLIEKPALKLSKSINLRKDESVH